MNGIYLINHTEAYNPSELIYGHAELPLVEHFTADFDWIKEQLPSDKKIVCYSSGTRRCQKLASSLFEEFELLPLVEDINFGSWELKSWNEIAASSKTKWRNDKMNFKAKGAESLTDLIERASECLKNLKNADLLSERAIVSGPYFLKALVVVAMAWPPETILNLNLNPASISRLIYNQKDDTFFLDVWNRTRTF